MYRALFWIFFATTIGLVIVGGTILSIRDKPPAYVLDILVETVSDDELSFGDYAYLPLQYVPDLTDSLPYSYEKNVKNLKDFDGWKQDIVSLQYGSYPTILDMDEFEPESEIIEDGTNHTLKRLMAQAFFDSDEIIFYELLPKGGATYNAVFVIPGSGHQGARDVLGMPSEYSSHYYHDEIARHLVREGYAVYTIELRGYGERQVDVGGACKNQNRFTCSEVVLTNKMAAYGISMGKIRLDEITQVLSYIESREYTDMVAVAGLSLGAGYAASTAVINHDTVDAAVLASGVGSVLYSPLNQQTGYGGSLLECCDTIDILATIAPTPMYTSYGLQERSATRWEAETRYTGNFLDRVYELHGVPDNFEHIAHDGLHRYDMNSVVEFFNNHMG